MNAEFFHRTGYVIMSPLLDLDQLRSVEQSLSASLHDAVGVRRMLDHDWCADLVCLIRHHLEATGILPKGYLAVQCTCFEKSQDENWLVAMHQDLSIPVQVRVDDPALMGWSEKDGMFFVQPPVDLLERLVALRLHIDDCREEDGALRVVPGSHMQGRLKNADALAMRDEIGEEICPVSQGGAMAMRPLLLHASSKATGNSRRRVLHFLFGPAELPHGLHWAYAV